MTKKQTEIPGTEKKSIKAVDKAAAAYVEARDARMRLTEEEVAATKKLVTLMQEHKLKVRVHGSEAPKDEEE